MSTQPNAASRKPTHRLFIISGEGEATNWTEIGGAWPNKDGKGFNLVCRAMPFTGLIVMREVLEREDASGGKS